MAEDTKTWHAIYLTKPRLENIVEALRRSAAARWQPLEIDRDYRAGMREISKKYIAGRGGADERMVREAEVRAIENRRQQAQASLVVRQQVWGEATLKKFKETIPTDQPGQTVKCPPEEVFAACQSRKPVTSFKIALTDASCVLSCGTRTGASLTVKADDKPWVATTLSEVKASVKDSVPWWSPLKARWMLPAEFVVGLLLAFLFLLPVQLLFGEWEWLQYPRVGVFNLLFAFLFTGFAWLFQFMLPAVDLGFGDDPGPGRGSVRLSKAISASRWTVGALIGVGSLILAYLAVS